MLVEQRGDRQAGIAGAQDPGGDMHAALLGDRCRSLQKITSGGLFLEHVRAEREKRRELDYGHEPDRGVALGGQPAGALDRPQRSRRVDDGHEDAAKPALRRKGVPLSGRDGHTLTLEKGTRSTS